MGFYVYSTDANVHYLHRENPSCVTIVNEFMKPVGATFHPLANDYDCAESLPANLFAIGYWKTDDLTIFDLGTGDKRSSFSFRKLNTLTFDETGRKLFFKSGPSVFLFDLVKAEAKQIQGVLAIDRQIAIKGRNEVVVGSQRKGELLRISLNTGLVASIPLSLDATFCDLKQNPHSSDVILIDRKKSVHCVDVNTCRVLWSKSLKKQIGKDHAGVGQFSGNGKLFGVAVSSFDHNYTIVLDADTGETVHRIDEICYGLPWIDNVVRDSKTTLNTYSANALDLSTGKTVVAWLNRVER